MMMTKNLLTLMLIALAFEVQGQEQIWKYDFGTETASFAPNPGASSTKFMPKPNANSVKSLKQVVRIRTASDGTGAINLVNSGASFIQGSGMEMLAGTSTSKFAIYGIAGTQVSKTAFDIKFDGSNNVQWFFVNGNSEDKEDVFQGNSNIKEDNTEIFAGCRWYLNESNEIKFYQRIGTKWLQLKNAGFQKNSEYHIEVFSNNSDEAKTYEKDGNHTLPPHTYDLWSNGKLVIINSASGGVLSKSNINALLIFGYRPKEVTDQPKIWVDNLVYSNNL